MEDVFAGTLLLVDNDAGVDEELALEGAGNVVFSLDGVTAIVANIDPFCFALSTRLAR